jgi:hypothetical protein
MNYNFCELGLSLKIKISKRTSYGETSQKNRRIKLQDEMF